MQRLSKHFRNVSDEASFFEGWKQKIDAVKKNDICIWNNHLGGLQLLIWLAWLLVSNLILGPVIGLIFHSFGAGLLFVILNGICAIATGLWVSYSYTPKVVDKIETEFIRTHESSPLYQRAHLILRALHEYNSHLENYQILCDQIDDGDIREDTEKMVRYLKFLDGARLVLANAVANFKAVVERVSREQDFYRKHPGEMQSRDGSALALLLGELVDKSKLPKDLLSIDPLASLEHEETLVQAVAELQTVAIPIES